MKQETGRDISKTLRLLLSIPHKILSFNEIDNIAEFILHEICHDECLDIERAAYFVDNPDFNCFKGISGIDRMQEKFSKRPVWNYADDFSKHMCHSQFNKKVREVNTESTKKQDEKDFMKEVAKNLCLNNHNYHCFSLRHGNRGFFLYEPAHPHAEEFDEIMDYATALLALCPLQ